MNFLFSAHSGTRYLVLLVGIITAVYALIGMAANRRFDRGALTLMRVFAGIIDLQILLGIATIFTRAWFPALIGHIVMMVAAAAVAHLGAARLKKMPEADRRYGLLLASAVIPLTLMVGGILAIQRSVF